MGPFLLVSSSPLDSTINRPLFYRDPRTTANVLLLASAPSVSRQISLDFFLMASYDRFYHTSLGQPVSNSWTSRQCGDGHPSKLEHPLVSHSHKLRDTNCPSAPCNQDSYGMKVCSWVGVLAPALGFLPGNLCERP